jgi:hypothetical protein
MSSEMAVAQMDMDAYLLEDLLEQDRLQGGVQLLTWQYKEKAEQYILPS